MELGLEKLSKLRNDLKVDPPDEEQHLFVHFSNAYNVLFRYRLSEEKDKQILSNWYTMKDNVDFLMNYTGCSRGVAKKALMECIGVLSEAIKCIGACHEIPTRWEKLSDDTFILISESEDTKHGFPKNPTLFIIIESMIVEYQDELMNVSDDKIDFSIAMRRCILNTFKNREPCNRPWPKSTLLSQFKENNERKKTSLTNQM